MDELYVIMEYLLDLEYKQSVFIRILRAVEQSFEPQKDQEELKMLASAAKWQMEGCEKELRQIIGQLDRYIVNCAAVQRESANKNNKESS